MEFFTTGVYGSTEESFFQKLVDCKIDMFCDIRQRRGVRGAKYSFVNSERLQTKLKELNIKYFHEKDLAPTKEIRNSQFKVDKELGVLKRERQHLGETFTENFQKQILDSFDFQEFLKNIRNRGVKKILLFCVEENHTACHRSLVTNKLSQDYNLKVTHI